MNISTHTIEKLFKELLKCVQALSSEQLDQLSKNKFSIQILTPNSNTKISFSNGKEPRAVSHIIDILSAAKSRNECYDEIDNLSLGKTELTKVLKKLKIPVSSRDTIATLKDKIVESTIGYKLTSEAIRGDEQSKL